MAKRQSLTAKERLIRTARTRLANRTKKIEQVKQAGDEQVAKLQREISEEKEILKALGCKL